MSEKLDAATRIALLRAVNLGPHNKVSMAKLRDFCAELALENPRTLLQSGNLVFECAAKKPPELEQLLEKEAKQRMGLTTDFFVRTRAEWQSLIENNPFEREAKRDPGHLVVLFLKSAPAARAVAALEGAIVGRERVQAKGRQAYVVYPDGIGRSKLTNAVIEKHLATRCSGRNWNTVLKLAAF